ncbi:MAG: AMP-binding protein [Proteobacteria bacterium]|nr:AMP-binding protein [Pseudomonadota bacterium]MBU4574912.1 AMP-binding protein [Pseudomonadota bacterium]MBU4597102.1 AMP-binding protein [Pseudomonadota bacterium]MBV1715344.1 AMP-binding protein [Desulfarculus sp.]
MLIGDIITYNAERYPQKLALVEEGQKLTYRELEERSNQLSRVLASRGLGSGHRVAVIEDTNINCIVASLGIIKTGAVLISINNLYGPKEIMKVLADCEPSALIMGPDHQEKVAQIKDHLPGVKHYFCFGDCGYGLNLTEEMSGMSGDAMSLAVSENQTFMILYTAGTTGEPKGAIYTHAAFWQNLLLTIIDTHGQSYDERWIGPIPLYHIGGFGTLLRIFLMSNTFYLKKKFDPADYIKTIATEKITILYAYPTMINAMVHVPDGNRFDLSSLKLVIYAGSPISERTLRSAYELFKCGFLQRYGATECCGAAILVLSPEDHREILANSKADRRRLQAAGKPSLGTKVKLLGPNNEIITQPWEPGVLLAKLPATMEGYWCDDQETAKVLTNGWLRLGDVAQFDEEGFYYLVDREKDMIVSGARNIYPREVEEVIYSHPAVQEACVIGVPDEYWGEAVKAVVVLKEGGTLGEAELIDYCKSHLASYKKPKSVDFAEGLPKNAGGKILKKVLRRQYWAGRDRLIH